MQLMPSLSVKQKQLGHDATVAASDQTAADDQP